MLKEIRIKNFKSLRDSGNLEIRPLTLLVGPNSSGKSSLIQFLLLLKQTVESRDFQNPLIFNGTCIELESYQNMIYKNDPNLNLEFTFSFGDIRGLRTPRISSNRQYHVVFHKEKENRVKILKFEVTPQKKEERISVKLNQKRGRYEIVIQNQTHDLHEYLRFSHFYPIPFFYFKEKKGTESKEELVMRSNEILSSTRFFDTIFSQGIKYLGPLREYPKRYYGVSGSIMEDVGFKGEKTIEVLNTSRKEIFSKVQKWIKKFDLAESIKIEPLMEKGTLVEVLLEDSLLGIPFNLYDVGFGVSQVLPIIVEGFYAPPSSLILIEQPEIHLHPKLQSEVGDLLIEISKEKSLIIETHSEHLLLRIQRRITEGTLKNSDVAIYFFTYTAEGTKVERIRIDDLGRFENWPPGFFEEDTEESFAITRAFLSRKRERRTGNG